MAALAFASNRVNQKALGELYEQDTASLVRMQSIENLLLEVRFRAAAVLLEQLSIPGSLHHVQESRKQVATLWSELEPTAARLFTQGEALAQFQRLKENWKLVDTALNKLEQGYLAKDMNVLTTVLVEDWDLMQKGAVKPLQVLIPITQQTAQEAYKSAQSKSQGMLTAGIAVACSACWRWG